MLVLTRKKQQSVVVDCPVGIGRLIKVSVLAIHSGRVSLGIDADDEVPIHRWEVWEKLRAKGELNRRQEPSATTAEAMDHWEDDGGAGRPAECPASAHNCDRPGL